MPVRDRGRELTGVPTRLIVVGLGNSLAGDDGVGPEVVRRLKDRYGEPPGVRLEVLGGDLYGVADLLAESPRFVFVDAIAAEPAGEIVVDLHPAPASGPSASLHQTDIAAVMQQLEALALIDPFPAWSVWGVTIDPPTDLREGLSPAVERGVERLVQRLGSGLESSVSEEN